MELDDDAAKAQHFTYGTIIRAGLLPVLALAIFRSVMGYNHSIPEFSPSQLYKLCLQEDIPMVGKKNSTSVFATGRFRGHIWPAP